MTAAITFKGEQLIATKQANQQIMNVDRIVLANIPNLDPANPVDRNEQMPPADQIVLNEPVSRAGYINPNLVVYSLMINTGGSSFDFNWMGLYSSTDNVIVAITYMPTQSKDPTVAMTRNFMIEYSGAQQTGDINISAESWQVDFTARLAGGDERTRQAAEDVFGRQLFYGDACLVTKADGDYYNIASGPAYVAGIRFNFQQQRVLVKDKPSSIWLDVSVQGNAMSDMQPVVEPVVSADALKDYVDAGGVKHYLVKISGIWSNGYVDDYRIVSSRERQFVTMKQAKLADNRFVESIVLMSRDKVVFKRTKTIESADYPDGLAKFTDINGINWFIDGSCAIDGYYKCEHFGINSDVNIIHTPSGLEYKGGVDQSDKINNLLLAGFNLNLPVGGIRISNPLLSLSRTRLKGSFSFLSDTESTGSVIVSDCDGDAIAVIGTIFEASTLSFKGFRLVNLNKNNNGYGINADKAVNFIHISECFVSDFGYGQIFVGSKENDRAGDDICIERTWVQYKNIGGAGVVYGNFNNILDINFLMGGGPGNQVKRKNGNPLSGTVHIANVQHELCHKHYSTISTHKNDKVFASCITRRSSYPEDEGFCVQPVSTRGAYFTVLHTTASGDRQRPFFGDDEGNDIGLSEHTLSGLSVNKSFLVTGDHDNYIKMGFSEQKTEIDLYSENVLRTKISSDGSFYKKGKSNDCLNYCENTSGDNSIGAEYKTNSAANTGAAVVGTREVSDGDIFVCKTSTDGNIGGLASVNSLTTKQVVKFGSHTLFVDNNGNLRLKNGIPINDIDGALIGS